MSPSRSSRGSRAHIAWISATVFVVIAVAGFATIALAKTTRKPKPLVKTAHSASQKATILVDANGMTLYELRPETSRHLLCTSSQCLRFWPPAKVGAHAKLVKGAGVKGKLGRLHRTGFDQLTLDGHPLYRFSGDISKGSTAGQGIVSFGGTWHVVRQSRSAPSSTTTTSTTSPSSTSTSASTSSTSTSTATSTATSTSSSGYTYPGY